MRLTVEEHVFILESYLKTMSYDHCRQSFFEKFRRQAPIKSAIAKMIKKNAKKSCEEHFFLPLHRACCHNHFTKNQLMHLFQHFHIHIKTPEDR
jgi:hypothetical protein